MASPPAGSPPGPSSLAMPRQRPPTLALPSKSRKSSLAPSTGSAHPLRQTSFPPSESLEAQHQLAKDGLPRAYSPGEDDLDDFSDSEITSAISGTFGDDAFHGGGRKRKRGDGHNAGGGRKGKAAKQQSVRLGSASVVNGDDARSTTGASKRGGTAGAPSVVHGEGEDDDEDDEDDDPGIGAGGGQLDAQELERENQRRYLFREAIPRHHQERYDVYNRVRLNKPEVRRLVNATLSQSVPGPVVTVVQAYAKMFAGMLIEGAREVQSEWMAVDSQRPDGEPNLAVKRLRAMEPAEESRDDEEEGHDLQDEHEHDDDGKDNENRGKDDGNDNDDEQSAGDIIGASSDQMDVESDAKPAQPESPLNGRSSSGNISANSSRKYPPKNISPNGQAEEKHKLEPNGEEHLGDDGNEDGKNDDLESFEHVQPGAWGLSQYIDECDCGPLLADHLRESLRRYKKSRAGGTVGFTGLSLERVEIAAPRMGGRRLFR